MGSVFTVAQKNKTTEDVIAQLEHALSSELFSVDEKLPCERDLQKQFQVSRGTIREALRMLRQKGWIKTTKGSSGGTFVIKPNAELLTENLSFLIKRSQLSLPHLIEFRHHMDWIIAQLAMQYCTQEQSSELSEKSKAMLELSKQENLDISALMAVDFKLNILSSQMTNNPFFEWIIQSLQRSVEVQNQKFYKNQQHVQAVAQNWIDYANALIEKNLTTIRAVLGYHHILLMNHVKKDKEKYL